MGPKIFQLSWLSATFWRPVYRSVGFSGAKASK